MLFYSDFLALMPTREHNLDELFQADMAESAKAGEKNAQVPAAANRLNRGGDVISLLEVCKLSYVRDICFLHGYNEPVLCLLHESGSPQSASRGPTWSGRLRDDKDTCDYGNGRVGNGSDEETSIDGVKSSPMPQPSPTTTKCATRHATVLPWSRTSGSLPTTSG